MKIRSLLLIVCTVMAMIFFLNCSEDAQAPFELQIFPGTMQAIPQQDCIFLLRVEDTGKGAGEGGTVELRASGEGILFYLTKASIVSGDVSELHIIPGQEHTNKQIQVELNAERKDVKKKNSVTVTVISGEDHLAPNATDIRNRFVTWLAENYPQLNIKESTIWNGTLVNPNITIVSYYLFFSGEWEMGLTYHVMIPPNDWARIYLRKRDSEWNPSHAFEISSLASPDLPHVITPPDEVIR